MLVSCSCGCVFRSDNDVAQCPYCDEVATLPKITDRDADEMQKDVDEILTSHSEI